MSAEKSPKPSVLIVDDEALIRWSLTEGLSDAGYSVRQAATGAAALVELETLSARPVVILLDLKLPDVSDLTLARRVRALRPDAPIIMITAHGTNDDAALARAAGVFAFVSKPFDVAAIVSLVDNAAAAEPLPPA